MNSVHAYGWRLRPVAEVIRALDRAGVGGIVNLDGGFGEHLSAEIARVQTPHPDRIAVFAGMDATTWSADSRFGDLEAARLEDSVRRGARGLKVWKDVGLHARDPDGRLVAIDDARLEPVWETARALNVPILIHVADPPAFFQPLDRRNERRAELRRHPDWHYTPIRATPDGPGFPSHTELIDQFARMVARHPGTNFIGAHLASCGEDLDRLSGMLRTLPNLLRRHRGAHQRARAASPRLPGSSSTPSRTASFSAPTPDPIRAGIRSTSGSSRARVAT